jgi:hypothetical protein
MVTGSVELVPICSLLEYILYPCTESYQFSQSLLRFCIVLCLFSGKLFCFLFFLLQIDFTETLEEL